MLFSDDMIFAQRQDSDPKDCPDHLNIRQLCSCWKVVGHIDRATANALPWRRK